MRALRASSCKNLKPKRKIWQEENMVVIEDYEHMKTLDENMK